MHNADAIITSIIQNQRQAREAASLASLTWNDVLTRGTLSFEPAARSVAVIEPPESSVFERPTSEDDADESYRALATKLGLKTPVLLEQELERVLEEEHIHVYDFEKVVVFLDNEVAKMPKASMFSRYVWQWKPLRDKDTSLAIPRSTTEVYTKMIPRPVLMTVDTISTAMPDAIFFVSEIARHPDPFLAVSVPGSQKLWVVERWDYVNFR